MNNITYLLIVNLCPREYKKGIHIVHCTSKTYIYLIGIMYTALGLLYFSKKTSQIQVGLTRPGFYTIHIFIILGQQVVFNL